MTPFTPYCLSLFYFLFFAWMGIQIPYFNLYLYHLGMTSFQIGIVTALIPLVRVFSPPFWGYLTDRYDGRGRLGTALWIISTIIFSLLFFTESFFQVALVITAFTFFWSPTLPVAEASAMELARKRGIDYGRMRLWGTVGFIGLSWLTGIILDKVHISAVLWGLLLLLVANIFVSTGIPAAKNGGPHISLKNLSSQILRREALIFLFIAMLMLVSHSTYYGFFSIYLESLGYSRSMIGILWALGPLGEVLVMFFSGRIMKKFGTVRVLAFSLLMAIIRWTLYAFAWSVPFLVFGQLLHAFTFGTFHIASVRYVEKLFPDSMRNTAQALYSSAAYGMGLVLGTVACGLLYDRVGAPVLFFLSALVSMVALGALVRERRRAGEAPVGE